MATTKMTQKDYFNEIIALANENGRDDIVKFAEGRIEILNRKTSGRKATKNQEANEAIKAIIVEVLTGAEPMTVTEIQATNDELGGYSNQKISALLRQLANDDVVEKTIDKKVSKFSLK